MNKMSKQKKGSKTEKKSGSNQNNSNNPKQGGKPKTSASPPLRPTTKTPELGQERELVPYFNASEFDTTKHCLLSPTRNNRTSNNNMRGSPSPSKPSASKKGEGVPNCSTPSPRRPRKQPKSPHTPEPRHQYAGAAFSNSPSPDTLPEPSFLAPPGDSLAASPARVLDFSDTSDQLDPLPPSSDHPSSGPPLPINPLFQMLMQGSPADVAPHPPLPAHGQGYLSPSRPPMPPARYHYSGAHGLMPAAGHMHGMAMGAPSSPAMDASAHLRQLLKIQ